MSKKRDSSQSNKKKIFFLSLFGIGLGIAIKEIFVVNQIECFLESDKSLINCSQLENLKGKSLFFYDFAIDENINQVYLNSETNQIYQIESIQKKLPFTLVVGLNQQAPVYKLSLENGEFFVVNKTGQMKKDQANLDLVTFNVKDSVKEQIVTDQKVEVNWNDFLNELSTALVNEKIKYQTISVHNADTIEIKLEDNLSAITELTTDPEIDVLRLNTLLDNLDLNMIDVAIKEIDLRFKLPVLRTTNTI